MIFMYKKDGASISIMKIIGISLIFILILGVSVMATEIDIRSVEITMANGYKMTVVTTKTNVEEILEDNNIVVEDDERVTPSLDDEITESNKITITNKSEQEVQIAKISESGVQTSLDEILKSYSPIIEKIVVEQEKIPYETITKDASQGSTDIKNKVIRADALVRQIQYDYEHRDKNDYVDNKKDMEKSAQSYINLISDDNIDYYEYYKEKYCKNLCKIDNKTLKEKLIQFRKDRSSEMKIPAYYVFTNDELDKIVELRPKTLEELKNLNILTPVKIKTHGEKIVEVINK